MSTTGAHCVHLLSQPDDVLLLLANSYLTDIDVASFGRTCRTVIHSLIRYEWKKKSITIVEMLQNRRWEMKKVKEALKKDEKGSKVKKKQKEHHTKSSNQIQSAASDQHPHQIGRITQIRLMTDDERPTLLSHLHLLPSCIRTVRIDQVKLSSMLSQIRLPSAVTRIKIASPYGGSIESLRLPSSLTELIFSPSMKRDYSIVHMIEKLTLPSSLQVLQLEGDFNAPIEKLVLPSSLRRLVIGCQVIWYSQQGFNHPIEKLSLNEGLMSLTIGGSFNYPIESLRLPSTLTQFQLTSEAFQHRLRDWIPPSSLTSFVLWSKCREETNPGAYQDLVFPKNLTSFNYHSLGAIFPHTHLPPHLKRLKLPSYNEFDLSEIHLPHSLTQLEFGAFWNGPLLNWNSPSSLQSIILGSAWNLPPHENLHLPSTLTQLTFGQDFEQRLDLMKWPSSLQVLTLRTVTSVLTPNQLPQNLPSTLRRVEILSRASSVWYMMTLPTPQSQFYEIVNDSLVRHVTEQQRDAYRATYLAAASSTSSISSEVPNVNDAM